MNKIVREHYPVSKLPEDLREELGELQTVRLVIEETSDSSKSSAGESIRSAYEDMMAGIQPMTFQELWEDRKAHPEKYRGEVTIEEAVARIRELRDEWDDDR